MKYYIIFVSNTPLIVKSRAISLPSTTPETTISLSTVSKPFNVSGLFII